MVRVLVRLKKILIFFFQNISDIYNIIFFIYGEKKRVYDTNFY